MVSAPSPLCSRDRITTLVRGKSVFFLLSLLFCCRCGGAFFFLLSLRGRVFFFAVVAGGRVCFFSVVAGGRVFFFAVVARGGGGPSPICRLIITVLLVW